MKLYYFILGFDVAVLLTFNDYDVKMFALVVLCFLLYIGIKDK